MKRLAIVLIGLTVGLGVRAATQGQVERFAYVDCQRDYWDTGELFWCNLYTDSGVVIADGTEPAWSPDGSRLAYSLAGSIFVLNLDDGSVADLGVGSSPTWSPDGLKIAFSGGELYVMDADGSSSTPLTDNVGFAGLPAWSRDGRIIFDCVVESGNRDICAINADGTGLVRLTTDPAWDSGAVSSPADSRIAFLTRRYADYPQIAIMNPDGSGLSRVGTGIAATDLAWLPDGTRIGFVQEEGFACQADGRICPPGINFVNADGTDTGHYGYGWYPAWTSSLRPFASLRWQGCHGLTCTFDGITSRGAEGITSYAWDFGDGISGSGATVDHTYAAAGEFTVALTVTDSVGATNTQSRVINVLHNASPSASYTLACSSRTCTVDASGSSDTDGTIASYVWNFGDGTAASGQAATHPYSNWGTYTVTLTVTDNGGATGTQGQTLSIVNTPPVAAFTLACGSLTCTANGSGSSDADGPLGNYAWNFGDGTAASGQTVTHTYSASGSYTIGLTVTDNDAATSTTTRQVTVARPEMHVGDLDGAVQRLPPAWSGFVTVTVHDSNHNPIANATVGGSWSPGQTAVCSTSSIGQCSISTSAISNRTASVTFTVWTVTHATSIYEPVANHDPDGDSNGASITVRKP
jgi:PKD repeat protein